MQRNLFFENPAAKSLLLVILLLLTALSHGFIQTNIEPQSLIEETRMEAHNNTSSPFLSLSTSAPAYSSGSTSFVYMDSYNLMINASYVIYWSLDNGTSTGNWNWTANNTYNHIEGFYSGLSLGPHCVDAELFENGTSVDTDSVCFSIISSMYPPSIYMWSNSATYYLGDTVGINIDAMNLAYESYEIDWTLNNGTQSGNYVWTAYNVHNSEYLNLSGLSVGYHCVDAELFENGTSVDTDTICFTIMSTSSTYPSGIEVSMFNTQIAYGNTAWVSLWAHNLTVYENYTMHWVLNGSTFQNTSISFYANYSDHYESLSFQNLSVGYYCISVDLYIFNATGPHWLDWDSMCFDVVNQSTMYPPSIYMWTNMATYYHGDTVGIGIDAMNLDLNESYEIDWTLINGTQSGNYVWTAYNTYNSEYLNLTGLPVGYHCVDAELFENGTSVDTDSICFQILSSAASTPLVDVYTPYYTITYGDTAFADFSASNLTNNETYTFHWTLNGTSFQSQKHHPIWKHHFPSKRILSLGFNFLPESIIRILLPGC